jgi:tetratricopeptide (TPR) repeat protein
MMLQHCPALHWAPFVPTPYVKRLTCLLLLTLAACVSPRGGAPGGPDATLDQTAHLIVQQQYAQAQSTVAPLLEEREFQHLAADQRHRALHLAAAAALGARDVPKARSLVERACALPQTEPHDWYLRIAAAEAAQDETDAARSLTVLATRWPTRLPALYDAGGTLAQAVEALHDYGSDQDRYVVLSALFDGRFAGEPDEASTWWRDLALLQLERGERTAALKTLGRVSDPYVAVSVEADRRFAPLRESLAGELSVPDIARWTIAFFAQQANTRPEQLEPRVQLATHLNNSLRFQDALLITEDAIERAEEHGPATYRDYDSRFAEIQGLRAQALYSLGRWEAAVEQLQRAADTTRSGEPNVGELIDLASSYVELGRPEDALKTLQRLSAGDLTARGSMEAARVRCWAAVQQHDASARDAALDYLRTHRHDYLPDYQEALLIAAEDSEAAQLLIERLGDARTRSDALLAVQEYGPETLPPLVVAEQQRWRALLARPDVQQAIGQVGVVGRYPLAGGLY